MQNSLFVKCCLIIIFILPVNTYADDTLKMHVIQASPIGFYDQEKKPTGYHWDYLTEIGKRSGISMKLILMPYKRIWKSLENGHHDGGLIYRSSDRDSIVEYVAPVAERKNIVISRKNLKIESYDDLYKLEHIATMDNVRLGEKFDADIRIRQMLKFVYDYETLVDMFIHRRYEAIAGNSVAIAYLLSQNNAIDTVELPGVVIGKRAEWLQFSKKSKHLDKIPRLEKAIDELKSEGFFDTVIEKYVSEEVRALIK